MAVDNIKEESESENTRRWEKDEPERMSQRESAQLKKTRKKAGKKSKCIILYVNLISLSVITVSIKQNKQKQQHAYIFQLFIVC